MFLSLGVIPWFHSCFVAVSTPIMTVLIMELINRAKIRFILARIDEPATKLESELI